MLASGKSVVNCLAPRQIHFALRNALRLTLLTFGQGPYRDPCIWDIAFRLRELLPGDSGFRIAECRCKCFGSLWLESSGIMLADNSGSPGRT